MVTPSRSQPGASAVTPMQAWAELHAGNQRFINGTRLHPNQDAERRTAVVEEQNPFAVIFGCSDSRLAAEIIFDRGLGDLFVVRTAGHVAGPEVLGSIEYAVTILRTPLVVVMGHDGCGAVRAALDVVTAGDRPAGHLGTMVDAVIPSVHLAAGQGIVDVEGIVDVHIQRTVDQLLEHSDALARAVEDGHCAVLGTSYRLSAGTIRVIGRPSSMSGAARAARAGKRS